MEQPMQQLLKEFKLCVNEVERQFSRSISQFDEGFALTDTEQKELISALDQVKAQYEAIQALALQTCVFDDPTTRRSVYQYVDSYAEHQLHDIRAFLQIRATAEKYQQALSIYQQQAEQLLAVPSDEIGSQELDTLSEHCRLFLQAIHTDLQSPQGELLMEQLEEYYPSITLQRGLYYRKYVLTDRSPDSSPDISDTSRTSDVPAMPDTPSLSDHSETPAVSEASGLSDTPDLSDTSDVPAVPDTPSLSDHSDIPAVFEAPSSSDRSDDLSSSESVSSASLDSAEGTDDVVEEITDVAEPLPESESPAENASDTAVTESVTEDEQLCFSMPSKRKGGKQQGIESIPSRVLLDFFTQSPEMLWGLQQAANAALQSGSIEKAMATLSSSFPEKLSMSVPMQPAQSPPGAVDMENVPTLSPLRPIQQIRARASVFKNTLMQLERQNAMQSTWLTLQLLMNFGIMTPDQIARWSHFILTKQQFTAEQVQHCCSVLLSKDILNAYEVNDTFPCVYCLTRHAGECMTKQTVRELFKMRQVAHCLNFDTVSFYAEDHIPVRDVLRIVQQNEMLTTYFECLFGQLEGLDKVRYLLLLSMTRWQGERYELPLPNEDALCLLYGPEDMLQPATIPAHQGVLFVTDELPPSCAVTPAYCCTQNTLYQWNGTNWVEASDEEEETDESDSSDFIDENADVIDVDIDSDDIDDVENWTEVALETPTPHPMQVAFPWKDTPPEEPEPPASPSDPSSAGEAPPVDSTPHESDKALDETLEEKRDDHNEALNADRNNEQDAGMLNEPSDTPDPDRDEEDNRSLVESDGQVDFSDDFDVDFAPKPDEETDAEVEKADEASGENGYEEADEETDKEADRETTEDFFPADETDNTNDSEETEQKSSELSALLAEADEWTDSLPEQLDLLNFVAIDDAQTPLPLERNKMYLEVSSPSLTPEEVKERVLHNYQQMLCDQKIYCATAYLKYYSTEIPDLLPCYQELAYAVNDPFTHCNYMSQILFHIYFHESTSLSECLTVAATLRNYFLDDCHYDYDLQRLQAAISGYAVMNNMPGLSTIVYKLSAYKNDTHCGMDRFADYRRKERTELEAILKTVQKNALEFHETYCQGKITERASIERFIQTKKIIFAPNGELGQCFESVIQDDRAALPKIQAFLKDHCICDNSPFRAEHLDPAKITQLIEDGWEQAAYNINFVKKFTTLKSSLRNNLSKLIERAATILCEYVYCVEKLDDSENTDALQQYEKLRVPLLEQIEQTCNNILATLREDTTLDLGTKAGYVVLKATLQELQQSLNGYHMENARKHFYVDFLSSDKILLTGEDCYLPILDDVEDVPWFTAGERILAHAQTKGQSLPKRFQAICNGGDDYGSAAIILQVLHDIGYSGWAQLQEQSHFEEAITYARSDAQNKFHDFLENLELAQSLGQIDGFESGVKETMIQSVEYWLELTDQTHNYGFFKQVLNQMDRKIQKGAKGRAEEIIINLDTYLLENPEVEDDDSNRLAIAEIRTRIQKRNYTAAEDLLGRLIAHDVDMDVTLDRSDDLTDFLEQYETNYAAAGSSDKKLSAPLRAAHLNKNVRGANRLIESWIPNGGSVNEQRIRDLMTTLGFRVDSVKQQSGKIENFIVKLQKPLNGRKSNYSHSIAVFGSQAESDGFRVICLFGSYNAESLIDRFREVGTAKHTIALLDFRLTLSDRRELAWRVKQQLPEKVFGVIDRVLLMYLSRNYSETSTNRKLMAVMMPFACYQPYVTDSSIQMPPEMFIGRKTELHKIEDAGGVSLVYGGRQLGKSALLKRAQSDIDHNENGDRAVFVDIKDMDYKKTAKKLSQELSDTHVFEQEFITEDWDELARAIKKRLAQNENRIPYLLVLMDEADAFIDSCSTVGYQPFTALKEVQSFENNRFKFVVTGLHNVIRFNRDVALKDDSVLPHYSSLTITPFKSSEARELLETPLRFLGFRFPKEADSLISMILGTTNYFPGLLQYYCSKLIEAMSKKDYAGYSSNDAPPYIIQEKHIKKVLTDESFQQQIREKFFITLEVGKDNLFYAIALLVAYRYHTEKRQNGCSPRDILETAREFGIRLIADYDEDQIKALMDEMRELNVLQYTGNKNYRFSRYNFLNMIGTKEEIEDNIEKFMEG